MSRAPARCDEIVAAFESLGRYFCEWTIIDAPERPAKPPLDLAFAFSAACELQTEFFEIPSPSLGTDPHTAVPALCAGAQDTLRFARG